VIFRNRVIFALAALTLLVRHREERLVCKILSDEEMAW